MSFGVPDEKRPWILQDDEARPLFRKALESGINFIDTANIYADGTSEELTGRMIKEMARRDEIVLATKVYNRMRPGPNGMGLGRKAIISEIDHSLRRLGTDYVDLYQIHRWDYETPIEETLEALHDVVKAARRASSAPHQCSPGNLQKRFSPPTYGVGHGLPRCKVRSAL
jgi:aryl-alcohol dehydrogenase-like predicted oxidoreductase